MREEEALRQRVKDLEQELHSLRAFEEAPYRAVVEDMSDLIVRWRPDGVRLFVNDAYCRLFGATRSEIVGTSFWSLIREDDRERVRARIFGVTPDAPVSNGIHRALGPTGETIWMEWVDRAVFDAEGNVVEMQSVGRDITERIRIEEQARQVESADNMSRMSAGIAHDLNNLLAVISNEVERLKASLGAEETKTMQQAIGGIVDLVRHLGMLRFGVMLNPETVDLGARVRRLLRLLTEVSGDRVVVRSDLAAEPCIIKGNPTQMDQVLLNLVKNAAEAMPDGGEIRIRTRSGEARVILEVEDTGPGIPPVILSHLFDPSVTTKSRGQGLGLATVKTIVESHGGQIRVSSSPSGAKFEVDLPAASAT